MTSAKWVTTTMEVKLSHHDWRALRRVARGKGKPVVGRELRLDKTRSTQDGSFLTRLVDDGLLGVSHPAPDPFESKYILTALGREAAEFGVYNVEWEVLKRRLAKE